eukprot:CAMPEP_0114277418 /NCGR_PEP_ID=MMETSP0059-20121206/780_1 /TAXON_ID=36894 /ORGANISM="Pyramimonas parkeae, Strain CCMP726" /LENGTH=201 /DNA_ID=CAMNT_0001397523 /DNA_START=1 /DNA_END=606 /DNA_ORIENTATION=+
MSFLAMRVVRAACTALRAHTGQVGRFFSPFHPEVIRRWMPYSVKEEHMFRFKILPNAGFSASTNDPPETSSNSASRKDLYMVFTCTVCETRAMKGMSRQAYEKGVVLVKCPGCQNYHLIADHLGWFEDSSWTVEKLLKERGENVRRGTDGTLELSSEDLMGRSSKEQSLSENITNQCLFISSEKNKSEPQTAEQPSPKSTS